MPDPTEARGVFQADATSASWPEGFGLQGYVIGVIRDFINVGIV